MKFILSIVSFWLFAQSALAAGLAVEPSKLEFKLTAGQTTEQKLTIENISVQEVIYQLYFDELNEFLTVDQPALRLSAGQKESVKVRVKANKAGIFATNLSIVGQELDRRAFNVSFGAKVPITLAVASAGAGRLFFPAKTVTLILLLLGALALTAIILKRRKQHWWDSGLDFLRHRPWWKIFF